MSKNMLYARSFALILLLAGAASPGWAGETPAYQPAAAVDEDQCGSTSSPRLALLPVEELIPCAKKLRREWKSLQAHQQIPPQDLNRALAATEKVLRQKADFVLGRIEAANTTKAAMRATSRQGVAGQEDNGQPQENDGDTEATKELVQKAQDEVDRNQSLLDEIRSLTSYRKDNTFPNFTDYDDFFSRLNAGYEFVSLNKAFEQGFPRVGLLINLALGGTQIHELTHGWQGLGYGPRVSFSATLTSSAEQKIELPTAAPAASSSARAADPTPTPETQTETRKALEFESQMFFPLYRTAVKFSDQAPGLRTYVGPLFTFGGLKTDKTSTGTKATDNTADLRYYGGIRLAFNPEQYWDFLYGKTDSLKSRRLEVRGQIPIHQLANGDRVYLGAIGNFRANDRHSASARTGEEPDVIRLYLSWNADLGQILSTKKPGTP